MIHDSEKFITYLKKVNTLLSDVRKFGDLYRDKKFKHHFSYKFYRINMKFKNHIYVISIFIICFSTSVGK